jgi:hypothetical protein
MSLEQRQSITGVSTASSFADDDIAVYGLTI